MPINYKYNIIELKKNRNILDNIYPLMLHFLNLADKTALQQRL